MPTWVWIVIVAAVVLIGMRLLARRAFLGGVDPTQLSLSPELATQVRELAVAGRRIDTIKLLTQQSGTSLAAAKLIVDRMAAPPSDR
jgi:hypothetical protein